ncbi:amidase [halophilic archaeon]|nr:amidase [halophilic archaeon]
MPVRNPSKKELEQLADQAGFSLTEQEIEDYADLVEGTLEAFERVQEIPEPRFSPHDIEYGMRDGGYRPGPDEDPHNVWVTKTTIEGADDGPLAGKTIGLKDSIALAGVEMTVGSQMMEGYTPRIDATIVDRLLDAGGSILGKLNMESFAFSGSSDTSDFGTVTNPRAPDHIAGGSSSGSGAAVAAGEVDIAIGGDQGGSIRIPASCCGIVGLKPTTGLVPYTGIFPIDNSLDHAGPMADSVTEVATTLDVLAGADDLDPRQPNNLEMHSDSYADALDNDLSETTVAVLEEGFNREESSEDVNAVVRNAIDELEALGAEITEVSMPRFLDSLAIWIAIAGYGGIKMYQQGGVGFHNEGWYNTDLATTYEKFQQSQSRDFPATVKATLLASEFIEASGHGSLYGKAQNISRQMRAEFDEILDEADIIAMPTIPVKPYEVDEDLNRVQRVSRTLATAKNTCPFDYTHHPALSIPCGTTDDLPVGLMLAGRRFDESTVLQTAYAYEQQSA